MIPIVLERLVITKCSIRQGISVVKDKKSRHIWRLGGYGLSMAVRSTF